MANSTTELPASNEQPEVKKLLCLRLVAAVKFRQRGVACTARA